MSVVIVWSVEFLPSKPAVQVRFPMGSGILIDILGLGVCSLCSVPCCLWQRPWHSTDHRFQGRALMCLSSVLVQMCEPLQASDARAFVLSYVGEG